MYSLKAKLCKDTPAPFCIGQKQKLPLKGKDRKNTNKVTILL